MDGNLTSGRLVWTLAAPMIAMGAFLFALGVFAAWNGHKQQQASSELVAREVHGMLAIDELHRLLRDIRYQVNLYLRTGDLKYLATAAALHRETDESLRKATGFARTER